MTNRLVDLGKLFDAASKKASGELEHLCVEAIHEIGISKTHSDLLGSHTVVTYPPLDSLQKIDANTLLERIRFQPKVDVYMHIPFCEYPCKFCPYTTLDMHGRDAGKIPTYLEAMKIEITTWNQKLREQNTTVKSLYLGGGTPFALSVKQLEEILAFVRTTMPFAENPEICIETSPLATLQEDAQTKLEILKKYGITRMSIGIQSFDFESLRDMARTFRGHNKEDEEREGRILL